MITDWKKAFIILNIFSPFALCYDTKIVNGSLALPGEFPFMVSIRRSINGRHSCGASLLNRFWVLTAAHCVSKAKASQLNIQYDSNDLDVNSTKVANISKIFVHQGYDPENLYIHDIALLRLNPPAKFADDFSGVRLPEYKHMTPKNSEATLIGWGLNAVSLRLKSFPQHHFCAGTILHPEWVLTAAHCFTFYKSPEDILVQYGHTQLHPQDGKYSEISDIIVHEGYSPTIVIHDIALLKLKTSVTFDENTKSVALPVQEYSSYENMDVQLLGWGLNETSGSIQSALNGVTLKIIPIDECQTQLKSVIHKSNLCAGGWGKGQCSGDSGGPLLHTNQQIALVSWSLKPCGLRPGVFTNVGYYLKWINAIISN